MSSKKWPTAPAGPCFVQIRAGSLVAEASIDLNLATDSSELAPASAAAISIQQTPFSDTSASTPLSTFTGNHHTINPGFGPMPRPITPTRQLRCSLLSNPPRLAPSSAADVSSDPTLRIGGWMLRTPMGSLWTDGLLDPHTLQYNKGSPNLDRAKSDASSDTGSECTDLTTPDDPPTQGPYDETKMTPTRRENFIKALDSTLAKSAKGTEGFKIVLGTIEKAKAIKKDDRAHSVAMVRLRIIQIRELITLLYLNLGYTRYPSDPSKADNQTNHQFVRGFTCGYGEFLAFLRQAKNVDAIQDQALLQNRDQVNELMTILGYDHDSFNQTVHEITIGTALETIDWLKASPPNQALRAFGWPIKDGSDPKHALGVLTKAIEGLLPPVVRQAYVDNNITKLQKYKATSLSKYVKFHGCTQTFRGRALKRSARSYIEEVLQRKKKEFFADAETKGWIPSTKTVNDTQAGLTVAKADLTMAKADLTVAKADLTVAKADLTVTKAVVITLTESHTQLERRVAKTEDVEEFKTQQRAAMNLLQNKNKHLQSQLDSVVKFLKQNGFACVTEN